MGLNLNRDTRPLVPKHIGKSEFQPNLTNMSNQAHMSTKKAILGFSWTATVLVKEKLYRLNPIRCCIKASHNTPSVGSCFRVFFG